jgi:hypothetical protein
LKAEMHILCFIIILGTGLKLVFANMPLEVSNCSTTEASQ